jgi:ATP-dependent RNA helicase DDX54/DBP10
MVPLIQKLGGQHSSRFGARSLIMVPTRELAVQVVKVGKDLARGVKDRDGEALRWALVVGGDSLEDQFKMMAANPDVYVARLLSCLLGSPRSDISRL